MLLLNIVSKLSRFLYELIKYFFTAVLNSFILGLFLILWGRLFHNLTASTLNALPPSLFLRYLGHTKFCSVGPWLFLIMISDLATCNASLWKYVDDTMTSEVIRKGQVSNVQTSR